MIETEAEKERKRGSEREKDAEREIQRARCRKKDAERSRCRDGDRVAEIQSWIGSTRREGRERAQKACVALSSFLCGEEHITRAKRP